MKNQTEQTYAEVLKTAIDASDTIEHCYIDKLMECDGDLLRLHIVFSQIQTEIIGALMCKSFATELEQMETHRAMQMLATEVKRLNGQG